MKWTSLVPIDLGDGSSMGIVVYNIIYDSHIPAETGKPVDPASTSKLEVCGPEYT